MTAGGRGLGGTIALLARILLGPLPATVFLLPFLFAAGLGTAIALVTALVDLDRSAGEKLATVRAVVPLLVWIGAAGAGVAALWSVTLADSVAACRQTRIRWWLAAGLLVGLLAAARWGLTMMTGGHRYGAETWTVWLVLLLGPLVMGTYYLARLLLPWRRSR